MDKELIMMEKYIGTVDDFLRDYPEIDPSMRPLIEKLFKEMESQLFNYVLNALS